MDRRLAELSPSPSWRKAWPALRSAACLSEEPSTRGLFFGAPHVLASCSTSFGLDGGRRQHGGRTARPALIECCEHMLPQCGASGTIAQPKTPPPTKTSAAVAWGSPPPVAARALSSPAASSCGDRR